MRFNIEIPLLTIVLLATNPLSAAPIDGDTKSLAGEFSERLKQSRYMEKGEGRPIEVAGWKGFPTLRYTYSITDKKDGKKKSADVILLDPTAEQISRWIVSALTEVNGDYSADQGRRVFKQILSQSGGQFPVAGVVYEDILPADGVNEIFCFRDGVTVSVEGVPHRGTEPMTPEQIEKSISGKVTRVFTFARIQSTSPQQWIAQGGSPAVLKNDKPTDVWRDEIRKAFQAAWKSDRNALLVAWVKANPK